MTTFLQDLRYAARGLRHAPGFTLVAALTLALGIGANAAMFGIVDALLFRPPSGVVDPGRVVRVQVQLAALPNEPGAELSSVLSYPDYVNLRDNARGFAGVAAFAASALTVGEGEDVRTQDALLVTGDYFRVLGTRPARGRFIAPDDDREGAPNPVVVLSWEFWRRTFPDDSGSQTLGKTLLINGRAFTVIGVAPKHFVGTQLGRPGLWVPLGTGAALGQNAQVMRSRFVSWLSVVARLAPGIERDQARSAAQAAMIAARDEGGELPTPDQLGEGGPMGGEVRVQIGGPAGSGAAPSRAPPPPHVRLAGVGGAGTAFVTTGGGVRPTNISLWFLAVTAAVLLIACANIANLMLARATKRSHEIAVRLSLGASRWRLTRQLMTESLLLALLGAAAGLWLAVFAVDLLPRVLPLPPLPPFLDGRVLGFTAVLAFATTVAFGLVPALRATRPDIRSALGTGGTTGPGRSLGRRALVVAQLAASLVLLIGAGLFIRSLRNVKTVDVGFDIEHLLVATADVRGARIPREQMDEYWLRALERVRTTPGVRSAALGMAAPFEMNIMMPVDAPGFATPDGQPRAAQADFAGVGYFATLGIAIVQGRAFTEEDRAGSAPVAIVNEQMARRIWGGQSPIGQCIRAGMLGPNAPCAEVVGVAGDAKYADITAEPDLFFYRPIAQRPRQGPPMTVLHVRATGDPSALAGVIRRELEGLDASVRFADVRPLTNLIMPQIQPWRVGTLIFTLFGALGLVLAAVGLYGVLSFLVAQRTRELGVRIALGAPARSVLGLVLGQGARLIAIGVVVGAIVGAMATQLFAAMMFGVSPLDPLVYAATALVLATIGMFAVYVPARRATQVDAMVALRAE